jgi:peptide/nickel transport system ATP-binding protein
MNARGAELRQLRAGVVSMIFQDPLSSLNPVHTIGRQVSEAVLTSGRTTSRAEARRIAIERLEQVGIPSAARRIGSYPHEFSGGMQQRVMIAMAVASNPLLLVADEPTTALDVRVKNQILELLASIVEAEGLAVLYVTHDLGTLEGFADRTVVMYGGRVVESTPTADVFREPMHPYTTALVQSLPWLAAPPELRISSIPGNPPDPAALPDGCIFHPRCIHADGHRCMTALPALRRVADRTEAACHYAGELGVPSGHEPRRAAVLSVSRAVLDREPSGTPLLAVRGLRKEYPLGAARWGQGRETVVAVDDVSFEVESGEILGLVGESGSGKSTVARCVMQLIRLSAGEVLFQGVDLRRLRPAELRRVRREIQVIFQDPGASLDPRMRVAATLEEPMRIHGVWDMPGFDKARVLELLELVQLDSHTALSYPHELSGGQRQRVAIARALALRPKLIVCDEPVSSLDVSTRAGVVNLLKDLQEEFGLSYLFIAHDLALTRHVCDRVGAMKDGRLVEIGDVAEVLDRPRHAYTRALVEAELLNDPGHTAARGRAGWELGCEVGL